MDRKETMQLLKAIAILFPASAPLAEEVALDIWERNMRNIPFDIAYEAFNEYVVESRYAPTISDIVKGAKKIQEENEKVLTRVRNTFIEICDMWGAKKSKELYDIFCYLVELNGPDLNKSLRIALDMKEAAIEYIKDKERIAIENNKAFTEIGSLKDWFEIYNTEVAKW